MADLLMCLRISHFSRTELLVKWRVCLCVFIAETPARRCDVSYILKAFLCYRKRCIFDVSERS